MLTVLNIYKQLKKYKNLKPSKKLNNLFFMLVDEIVKSKEIFNLPNKIINDFQKISSKGETEMEIYWAKKIIKSNNPFKTLKSFWYYKNYEKIINYEIKNIDILNNKRVLFIGSGPLPISSILLAKKYNLKITLLDKDKNAILLSQKVINKLKLSSNFEFINKDINSIKDLDKYDIVYMAALVLTKGKEKKINDILGKLVLNKYLITRSSYHNRVLLYKPLELDKINFKPKKEIKTYDDVINSILIYKK